MCSLTGQGGADKLARLMPGLPQYIEPLRLTESGEEISGSLPVSALQRLAGQLHDPRGTVEFRLVIGKNEQGLVRIRGEYSTQLTMTCQRCLEPLGLRIANTIDLALVPGAVQAGQLPAEIEPLTLVEGHIHLASFIQQHNVHQSLDDMERFRLRQMPVGANVTVASVDDQHLVQPVVRVPMRAESDPFAWVGGGALDEIFDVAPVHLHDWIFGVENLGVMFPIAHHIFNEYWLAGKMEANAQPAARFFAMTFSSLSTATLSRHSFTSRNASEPTIGSFDPGM